MCPPLTVSHSNAFLHPITFLIFVCRDEGLRTCMLSLLLLIVTLQPHHFTGIQAETNDFRRQQMWASAFPKNYEHIYILPKTLDLVDVCNGHCQWLISRL